MDDQAYTREELNRFGDGFPDRGTKCEQCGVRIPNFVDLSPEMATRIRKLHVEGRTLLAMRELIAATGCPLRFAKIWMIHDGRARPRFLGPPCPYCGKPLRTSMARQCPHCFADWHEGR